MSLCRTCLSENDLKPIFPDNTLVSSRTKQLYILTGVQIELNDGLPQLICKSCTSLIQSALKLREQSSKSQETLKKTIRSNIKKEIDDDCVKNEQNTEYYIASLDQQTTGRQVKLSNELNSNVEHEENGYMLIQIQNAVEHTAMDNSNLEHEKNKNVILNVEHGAPYKKLKNLNSECGRKLKNIKTSNLEHGRKYKNAKLKHDKVIKRRGKYWLKKYGRNNSDYKYSVSIEDFESSNDEDLIKDCLDGFEISNVSEKPVSTVRIEDFESSGSSHLHDVKSDSSDFEEFKYVGEESTEVNNEHMREQELLQREKRKVTSKEQESKLMSLAVTPYNKMGPIKCRICESVVRNVQNFKCHAKTHFELENTCEECGKKFATRSHMRYHQQRMHGRTKRLACTQCPYRAVDPQTLQNHERAEHTGERPYVCDECGLTFRMRANIMQHMRKHFGVRNLQCDRCPAMFRSRSELCGHQNKVHLMIYTYLCYLCPETYKRPLSVRKHLANVHGVPSDQQLKIKCIKTRRRGCEKNE